MLIAVGLVALVANVSAIRRLSKLARAVGGPKRIATVVHAPELAAPGASASEVLATSNGGPSGLAPASAAPRSHREAEVLVDAPR